MSYPTPRVRVKGKAGAQGGGVDDGPALKAWFEHIAENGRIGTLDRWYFTSQNVAPEPGTTIYGVGREVCGIGAHPSFPLDKQLLHLRDGVRMFDLGLRGTPALREAPGAAMVTANGDDILLHGCGLSWWRTLLAPAATNRLKVTNCDLGHYGDSITLPERNSPEGQAISAANAALHPDDRKPEHELPLRGNCVDEGGCGILGGNGSWPNADAEINGGVIHDGNWTAIDCMQPNNVRWQILNLQILRVKEAGIYVGVSAIIDHVTILDVLRRDCSAHCVEGSGIGTRLTYCTFGRPDAAFVFFTNPVDAYLGHSTMFDPMEEGKSTDDVTPWSAAIFARNTPAPPELRADGLTIEHNDIANARGKASYLLSMFDQGGGPFHNVTLGPNRRYGKWAGGALCCDHAAMGSNFHVIGALA